MRFCIIFLLFWVRIEAFFRGGTGSPSFNKNLPRFRDVPRDEMKRKINIDYLPPKDLETIKQIQGLFGIIGPDIDILTVDSLYNLFAGNGIIQGVFFDRGELTLVKHHVKTDKLSYEQVLGKLAIRNKLTDLILYSLNKVGLIPNMFGSANTAMVKVNNRYYALFERDLPYEVGIDFQDKVIYSVGKKKIGGIETFSAHPTIRENSGDVATAATVETLEYSIMRKTVKFHTLDENLVLQKTIQTDMKYMPIVHDFISTRYNYIVLDAPLAMKFSELPRKPMPVSLAKNQPTFFRVVNKFTGRARTFQALESFYIFHYAQIREDEERIMIWAPVYDNIDFSSLYIKGKYRQLVLDKHNGHVSLNKNEELENLNLDFPVRFEDKILLRRIKNNVCDGFVICRDLEIVRVICLENKFVCGEPGIIYVKDVPYLVFFSFKMSMPSTGTLTLLNLHNYRIVDIPLGEPVRFGFHSFFAKET